MQQRHILTFEFSVECSCVSAEGSLSYPPQKKHFTGSLATAFCILYLLTSNRELLLSLVTNPCTRQLLWLRTGPQEMFLEALTNAQVDLIIST